MIPVQPPRPLRARETAQVSDEQLTDGRRRLTIRHALLNGVTPEMLDWWCHHVGGEMDYAGDAGHAPVCDTRRPLPNNHHRTRDAPEMQLKAVKLPGWIDGGSRRRLSKEPAFGSKSHQLP